MKTNFTGIIVASVLIILTYQVNAQNQGLLPSLSYFVTQPTTINTKPLLVDDEFEINEDGTGAFDVLQNDSDADQDILRVISASAELGEVSVDENYNLQYTPPIDYTGQDFISYSVTDDKGGIASAQVVVTIIAINDTPVANDDDVTAFSSGYQNVFIVLVNDTDVENDTLSVVSAVADLGSVTINPDNSLSYIHNQVYRGIDTITYTISDGQSTSAEAQVSIDTAPLNNAIPLITGQQVLTVLEDKQLSLEPSQFNIDDVDSIDFTLSIESQTAANYTVNGNTVSFRNDFNGEQIIAVSVFDGVHTSEIFNAMVTEIKRTPNII